MENKVTRLKKWSVITSTAYSDLVSYVRFLDKLVKSCDARRTEFIFVGESNVYVTTLFDGRDFKIIPAEENVSFVNTGLKIAIAPDLVVLDNNVLIPTNWLVRLSYCLNISKETMSNVGMVVPVTCTTRVGGPQANIKTLTPDKVDDIQEKLDEKFVKSKPWVLTGTMSDFCIMMSKEVYQATGSFDDSIKGDLSRGTDWCMRALDAGFNTCLAGDIYTCREVDTYEENPHLYIERDLTITKKLATCYRVQIDDVCDFDIFVDSVRATAALSDYIFILDANSKYKVKIGLQEKYPDIWNKITKYEKFSRPYDEKHDYNDLLHWVSATDANWVLMLEDHELVEDKLNRRLLQKLMHPINRQVKAYTLNQYFMWNDATKWRSDNIWGQVHDVRLFEFNKNFKIDKPGNLAPLCGYGPKFPLECIRDTSVRILGHNFLTEAKRLTKKALFEKMGRTNNENYDYFITETNMVRHSWLDDTTLSVYAPANKGGDRLLEWLDHIWYFADEVVVGNDGLDTSTVNQLKNYEVKVIPTIMKDNFSAGRNAVISQCTQEFILQLDIDERISGYALFQIRRLIDNPEAQAWMFSIDNLQKDGSSVTTDTIRLIRNSLNITYWGFLHETLDDYVRENRIKVAISPVRLLHFGFLWIQPEDQFKKMQRYLELNFSQMKKFPMDGRAYYNLALHLLEDGIYDDGFKLLQIGCMLPPTFALPLLELSKGFVKKAIDAAMVASKYTRDSNNSMSQGIQDLIKTLDKVKPIYVSTAKGHALAYFQRQPQKLQEIREHLADVEETIVTKENSR